jgi:hypothetical protein
MMIIEIASVFLVLIVVSALIKHIDATREHGWSIPRGTLGMAKDGYNVRDVTGFSIDSNTSSHEGLIITVKPMEGSAALDLNDTVIYVQVGNRTARLHIRNGTTERDREEGFYTR